MPCLPRLDKHPLRLRNPHQAHSALPPLAHLPHGHGAARPAAPGKPWTEWMRKGAPPPPARGERDRPRGVAARTDAGRILRHTESPACPVPLYPRKGTRSIVTGSPPHSGTRPTTSPHPIRGGTLSGHQLVPSVSTACDYVRLGDAHLSLSNANGHDSVCAVAVICALKPPSGDFATVAAHRSVKAQKSQACCCRSNRYLGSALSELGQRV